MKKLALGFFLSASFPGTAADASICHTEREIVLKLIAFMCFTKVSVCSSLHLDEWRGVVSLSRQLSFVIPTMRVHVWSPPLNQLRRFAFRAPPSCSPVTELSPISAGALPRATRVCCPTVACGFFVAVVPRHLRNHFLPLCVFSMLRMCKLLVCPSPGIRSRSSLHLLPFLPLLSFLPTRRASPAIASAFLVQRRLSSRSLHG